MDYSLAARGIIPGGAGSERPAYYKAVGISLAVGSGVFIGTSFVLKKVGLLTANAKYNEVAGEGYGYLKNAYWWAGMILMIIGEICNFVAYAFTDAILVTPLGALSVVITTVLSAIFLKERLSLVGKVSCFLCIVGSIVIVMNAPQESSVADIQEMRHYVITPGFLSYAGVIIVGSVITAFFVGPKYGNKNMLVYISICSWIGGLSVVSTQGLGAAIIAWASGKPQYKEWFLWVLLVFVIGTLLTEIIFLNKALNLFNAAIVTPTYYVYFTSTTIITSTVLFQGFKGTPQSIVTCVLGFLTICSGVVLLQLSKSAKDVPDACVFSGNLDQIHTIAEQEQSETEPKADAIRGAAAIVRRISNSRLKMEAEELKRLHEEKRAMQMEPIGEDGQHALALALGRRRPRLPPPPLPSAAPGHYPSPRGAHPPLGMSRFPTDEELEETDGASTIFSSIAGTIRRSTRRGPNVVVHPLGDYQTDKTKPVPLTEIAILPQKIDGEDDDDFNGESESDADAYFGPPRERPPAPSTEYLGIAGHAAAAAAEAHPPPPPPHGTTAKRQFSFNKVFRRTSQPSEEERVGLVRTADGDPNTEPGTPAPEARPAYL
ncbi:Magnesium transporter NIPA2 [Escovopsis weberi]|uniref:Magnesium transporter NIPA2 n=1 Tax=Escovopsis weberi TaxID=150374 RepID=A0A0M9VXF4_ESCWE|nr:Magnesium transporter NIPA2 [Escovopsis weberi]